MESVDEENPEEVPDDNLEELGKIFANILTELQQIINSEKEPAVNKTPNIENNTARIQKLLEYIQTETEVYKKVYNNLLQLFCSSLTNLLSLLPQISSKSESFILAKFTPIFGQLISSNSINSQQIDKHSEELLITTCIVILRSVSAIREEAFKFLLDCLQGILEVLKWGGWTQELLQPIQEFLSSGKFTRIRQPNSSLALFTLLYENFKEFHSLRDILAKEFGITSQEHSNIPYYVIMVQFSNPEEKLELANNEEFIEEIRNLLMSSSKHDTSGSNLQKQGLFALKYLITYFGENYVTISNVISKKLLLDLKLEEFTSFWTNFFDLYEILDEKQAHIINPFLGKIKHLLDLQENEVVNWWLLVILQKVLRHDNRNIAKEGLYTFLNLSSWDTPAIHTLLWDFLKSQLLPILNKSIGWMLVVEGSTFFESASKLSSFFATNQFSSISSTVLEINELLDQADGLSFVFIAQSFNLFLKNQIGSRPILAKLIQSLENLQDLDQKNLGVLESLTGYISKKGVNMERFLKRVLHLNLIEIFTQLISLPEFNQYKHLIDIKVLYKEMVYTHKIRNEEENCFKSSRQTLAFIGNLPYELMPYWNTAIGFQFDFECQWSKWQGIKQFILYIIHPNLNLSQSEFTGVSRLIFLNSLHQMNDILAVWQRILDKYGGTSGPFLTQTLINSLLEMANFHKQNTISATDWFGVYDFVREIKEIKGMDDLEKINLMSKLLGQLKTLPAQIGDGEQRFLVQIRNSLDGWESKFSQIYYHFLFANGIPDNLHYSFFEFQPALADLENILPCTITCAERDLKINKNSVYPKLYSEFFQMKWDYLRKVVVFTEDKNLFEKSFDVILDEFDSAGTQGVLHALNFFCDTASLFEFENAWYRKNELENFVRVCWSGIGELKRVHIARLYWSAMKRFMGMITLDIFDGTHVFSKYSDLIMTEAETTAGLSLLLMDTLLRMPKNTRDPTPIVLRALELTSSQKEIRVFIQLWEYLCSEINKNTPESGEKDALSSSSKPIPYFNLPKKGNPGLEDLLELNEKGVFKNTFTSNSKARFLATFVLFDLEDSDLSCKLQGITDQLLSLALNPGGHFKAQGYYGNSAIHRIKNRVAQTLLILQPLLDQELSTSLCWKLMDYMTKDAPQPSIRYFTEWFIIRVLIKFPTLHSEFFERALKCWEKRFGFAALFSTICLHVSLHLESSSVERCKFVDQALQLLFGLILGQHFTVRLYSQASLLRIFKELVLENEDLKHIREKYRIIYSSLSTSASEDIFRYVGNYAKITQLVENDFYIMHFDPLVHYSLETIFIHMPKLSGLGTDEVVQEQELEVLLSMLKEYKKDSWVKMAEIYQILDSENKKVQSLYKQWEEKAWHLKSAFDNDREIGQEKGAEEAKPLEEASEVSNTNLQRKVNPWRILQISEAISDFPLTLQTRKSTLTEEGLIVVASLIDKPANLGGLCRTCEIFGVSKFAIPSLRILKDPTFRSLSVSSQNWVEILEVKSWDLKSFLRSYSSRGWTILAIEQACESVKLNEFQFPKKSIILLGNEKTGISAEFFQLVDTCIEIPQVSNIIRSLNVHVTGALTIWQYSMQHNL